MPIIEMRESLGSTDVQIKKGEKLAVIQKRINLKEGSFQRNMLQMDLFFDDYPQVLGTPSPKDFQGIIEFFVTPTPIILTTETVRLAPNAGPLASNQLVLFKAILEGSQVTRFPQDFLATNANFPFFHDQLFITMVFHRYEDDAEEFVRFAASFYMSYSEKKIPSYRAAMGVISERFASMLAKAQTNGRTLQNVTDLAGSFIPAYNWGGIRPEYMVNGQTLTQFFLNLDSQASEQMQGTGTLRTFAAQARQMVSNPDAFGSIGGSQGSIPDWFVSILPKGVEAGAVRPQFPPRVTQDNPAAAGLGNILMV
jgi:hypothetical protein